MKSPSFDSLNTISRREFLQTTALTLASAALPRLSVADSPPQATRIFENGQSRASIVLGANATKQVQDAASLLAQYFERCTGSAIVMAATPPSISQEVIRIGDRDRLGGKKETLEKLDSDGFVIDFPDSGNVVLTGASDWGTEFAVYEFLERYLGVRWLFPGADGEYAPKLSVIDLPMVSVIQEPAFFSREVGVEGDSVKTWARRNRIHSRIQFHHNLRYLFPPETYMKTHPEFFPLRNGLRYFPPPERLSDWQPCFSAKGIVEEAVRNIRDYFTKHPEETSFSLGVNDSGMFCDCEACRSKYGQRKNFLGYDDRSDEYYEWANAVAAEVLKEFPDKWFGCLAYREVLQPPSVNSVHPRIIPYLTYDRLRWVDPSSEAQGRKITEDWAKKARVIGWYDYIYGAPYCVPRLYPHHMANYYRLGRSLGVRTQYAEAYPNWGEGPKLYISLRLQWDPNLDPSALMSDWCAKAVGTGADSDLVKYCGIWENFWTRIVPKSPWFSGFEHEYLPFMDPGYLLLITDEIIQSRKLLDHMAASTKTAEERKRAEVLRRAFDYYEASAVSYLGLKGNKVAWEWAAAILGKRDVDRKYFQDMASRRKTLVDEFSSDPVLTHDGVRFDRFKTLQW